MRIFTPLVLCIFSVTLHAQKKIEKYFDYQWHECQVADASFYGVIIKTDSGWHRQDYFIHGPVLQMDGTYEDSACKVDNGLFYYFYPNKQIQRYGHYKHGKMQGLLLSYHPNGMMSDSTTYDNNNPVGLSMAWYPTGDIEDSVVYQTDGAGVGVYWFDNGNPAAAGRFKNWKPYGKWQYFHATGKLSSIEVYDTNKTVNVQYYSETGSPMDTTGVDQAAAFPGGATVWQNYLMKHLYFPEQYKITNADKAVAVITFTVDIDGKVKDAYVSTPFFPQFDEIALNVIKKSPPWQPALQHGRKVPYYQRQSVFFSQVQQ